MPRTTESYAMETELRVRLVPTPIARYTINQTSTDSKYETISTSSQLPNMWPVKPVQNQRDEIREKLLKAGFLVTDIEIPYVSDGYLDMELPLIVLPPNSPSVAQLVDEDRGEY